MNDLLLHPATKAQIEVLLLHPAQSIVLAGDVGAGKSSLALSITAALLTGGDVAKLINQPYFLHIAPEGKEITIDQVRQSQKFLSLKTTGTAAVRRVLLLEHADKMNTQAQNALLKTLEEPPADTLIIMTAAEMDQLLPTIRSRTQVIYIRKPLESDARTYFKGRGYDDAQINRAYAMSDGAAALMNELLQNAEGNSLVQDITAAKDILVRPIYDRLLLVDAYSKDKESVAGLLNALRRICKSTLELVSAKSQQTAAIAWHKRLELVVAAEEANARSANQKLLLTDLFINL